MNALLAFGRLVLAHREKAVLVAMILLCGGLALANQLTKADEDSPNPDAEATAGPLKPGSPPREERTYEPAELSNRHSWDEVSDLLRRRPSIFRPGGSVSEGADGGGGPAEAWPEFSVRNVSQPTPGGVWIAQLEIDGRAYIAREGRPFANNQYELQRIDKTRLCVEVLRRLDDQVREFCQE